MFSTQTSLTETYVSLTWWNVERWPGLVGSSEWAGLADVLRSAAYGEGPARCSLSRSECSVWWPRLSRCWCWGLCLPCRLIPAVLAPAAICDATNTGMTRSFPNSWQPWQYDVTRLLAFLPVSGIYWVNESPTALSILLAKWHQYRIMGNHAMVIYITCSCIPVCIVVSLNI